MKLSFLSTAITVLVWSFAAVAAAPCLSADDARHHVGENTCVCGVVASTRYAQSTGRQPTFLNFDKPYPNQIFTAVIWGADRSKFGEPERAFEGKHVCVTGAIELYREKPEIIVHDPAQLNEEGGQ